MNIEIKNLEDKYLYPTKANKSVIIGNTKPGIYTNRKRKKFFSTLTFPHIYRQIYNQGTMSNKMLNYIKEMNCVTGMKLIKEMTKKYGYKESSGSIGCKYSRPLKTEGLIRVEGKQKQRQNIFCEE
ncbi:MAG: hypothetical protein WDO71_18515 [Bacteroidota bacterium]